MNRSWRGKATARQPTNPEYEYEEAQRERKQHKCDIYLYIRNRLVKNGGKRDKKVSDDVRDRIRATSSIGGVRIVSLGCGEVLGTHEPTMFNHNGPLYCMTFLKIYIPVNTAENLLSALSHAKTVSNEPRRRPDSIPRVWGGPGHP